MFSRVGQQVKTLLEVIGTSKLARVTKWGADSLGTFPALNEATDALADANVYSSERRDEPGMHRILLDVDMRFVHVEPSSTPGNYHLVIDGSFTWQEYRELLEMLRDLNVIQNGYYEAALQRKATYLRLPWVKK